MGGRAVGGDLPSTPPPPTTDPPLPPPCDDVDDDEDEGTDVDVEDEAVVAVGGACGDPSLVVRGEATFCGVANNPPGATGDFLARSCNSCILWLEYKCE